MRMDDFGRSMTGALRGVAVAAVLGLGLTAASGVHAQDFETPSNRQASQILPANLISGPYHRVRGTVVSYGYMHHYKVDSQFGVFEATGDGALRKLVNEIYAIASLKEFKTGEAYLTAVGEAAKAPFSFAKNLITDPVDTVSGIPQGVFQIFGNVAEGITMEHDPAEDSRVKQLLFVSSWKRDFATERGVDVYSSNKVLQEELNSVGWAAAIGGLTVSAATMGASATGVVVMKNLRLIDQIGNALKEEPPGDCASSTWRSSRRSAYPTTWPTDSSITRTSRRGMTRSSLSTSHSSLMPVGTPHSSRQSWPRRTRSAPTST